MELTITWGIIAKACIGFLGIYILMPLALIIRDFLVTKFIEKFIFNYSFFNDLERLQRSKAMCDFRYNKNVRYNYDDGAHKYFIADIQVSEVLFHKYENESALHMKTVESLSPTVTLKINWMRWSDKYFKMKTNGAEIASKSAARIYKDAVNEIKSNYEDIIYSDISDDHTI
ncbi:hypothetical protein [Sodalis sp. RH16]|uniref:hypothetical protein n=1 Tax=Sodalis sp. RH16 TaxID=3394331 RepID=UPI0039B59D82